MLARSVRENDNPGVTSYPQPSLQGIQVTGLDPQNATQGKDLVGLVGLGTFKTFVEFADVAFLHSCQ